MKIDRAFIEQHKSSRGGWNYAQLSCLGVEWPPRKGWIARAIAADHTAQALDDFVSLASRRPGKGERKAYRALANKAKEPIKKYEPKVSSTKVCSADFLQSYEWRRVRMEALKKYGARCQCCGATPATGAVINVDHIKPRKLFPQLALSVDNLQVLCHECNHGKGNWDMTDWRKPTLLELARSALDKSNDDWEANLPYLSQEETDRIYARAKASIAARGDAVSDDDVGF